MKTFLKLKKKIFKNVFCVVSGYSEPETKELSKLLQVNGATVTEKWNLKGESKSTHLICETFTNIFDHVGNLGGLIVNRKWIDDSIKQNKKLKENPFLYPKPKEEKEEKIEKSKIEKPKIEKSKIQKDKFGLYDIFSDCVIYIDPESVNDPEIKRYIIAYDGIVVDKYDEDVTHILTIGGDFPKAKCYRPSWVWDKIKEIKK